MRYLDTDKCDVVFEPDFTFENNLYESTQCTSDIEMAMKHRELDDILSQRLVDVPDVGVPRADDKTMCDCFIDRFVEPSEISLYMSELYNHDLKDKENKNG